MQAIGFNEHYGLQTAVVNRIKTMTRRAEKGLENLEEGNFSFNKANGKIYIYGEKGTIIETIKTCYKIGEVVAIRQRYRDIADDKFFINAIEADGHCVNAMKHDAGWDNKMFVKAAYMPQHIRIIDIKINRLQDISDEDCLKEGIKQYGMMCYHWEKVTTFYRSSYRTPQQAFAALIDKVSGKGTWYKNPYVVAYSFEKID